MVQLAASLASSFLSYAAVAAWAISLGDVCVSNNVMPLSVWMENGPVNCHPSLAASSLAAPIGPLMLYHVSLDSGSAASDASHLCRHCGSVKPLGLGYVAASQTSLAQRTRAVAANPKDELALSSSSAVKLRPRARGVRNRASILVSTSSWLSDMPETSEP